MEQITHFSSPIYKANVTDYLQVVSQVAEESVVENRKKEMSEAYPVVMSNDFSNDPKVLEFGNFIAQYAWEMLDTQGYNMAAFTTHVGEMWMQEHHKYSLMEQHVHRGYHIVGFYILDVPETGAKVLFHDPKPGKVMMGLPEKNSDIATLASDIINFDLNPGDLIFTNAWLPHSFTRNASDTPLKFVHFNIYAQPVQRCPAEVI